MVHCLEYLTSLSKVTCPNPTQAETETLTVHPAEKRKYYLTNIRKEEEIKCPSARKWKNIDSGTCTCENER